MTSSPTVSPVPFRQTSSRLSSSYTATSGVSAVSHAPLESTLTSPAIEERVWTVRQPSAFYTFFGSPGGAASSDLAVEAFEDDVALSARQILNLLATLNENPYIRFYQPAHHGPLGALALTASGQGQGQAPGAGGGAVPSAQARGDQPQSLRWRSAMAGGPPAGGSRPGQVQPEHLSKRLANEVQGCLDEYMRNNPEFPVSPRVGSDISC